MTGPSPGGEPVAALAAWDVPLVRGAVATLDAVADRLPTWRARLEGVGRSLESGRAWSGPSARSAVGLLYELSAVTSGVEAATAESAAALHRLADEADAAQACAARAAALPGGRLAELVLPEGEHAHAVGQEALRHAVAAAVAAEAARTALAAPGSWTGLAPVDLVPFAVPVHTVPGAVPSGSPPRDVSAWWTALPAAAQLALLHRNPALLGGLDGVPAWARDRANRRVLAAALDDPGLPAATTARVVAKQIRAAEALGRPVQLHLLELDRDLVALGLGDLDTAEAVAVLVPGIANSPADDLGRLTGVARDVGSAARAAAPGTAVATMVWLGYRTPHTLPSILSRRVAAEGGGALAAGLAGLAEARGAVGRPPARTTVLAHSYGTVVVDEAADVPGALEADVAVLLGSPGMEGEASDLEVPEVYDVASSADLVAHAAWFGVPTSADCFGSVPLPRDPWTGHSEYYERGSSSLAAIGEVVGAPWPPP